jgi:hypothetical protein
MPWIFDRRHAAWVTLGVPCVSQPLLWIDRYRVPRLYAWFEIDGDRLLAALPGLALACDRASL